ncbi:MAG: tetratricopeptide repeat protein, partial [Planctomycetota bacterium]|nr:tetratricopeptide repeat protein [Planctomycetota bacterium]
EGSLYAEIADPKLRYENQLHALKELVKALAFQSPLVLEVEDAHLIDPSTADWVRLLTRNVKDVPFLVVLTSRYCDDGSRPKVKVDDDVPVQEMELRGIDESLITSMFVEALSKEPLSKEQGVVSARPPHQRAIQGVVEATPHTEVSDLRPAPVLTNFLMERTGGNPFFAEQLILHLRDNGLLAEGPGGMALVGDMGRLPATLDSLLLARLDKLELNLREGLKHAAVLGVRFLKKVLEELLRGSREFAGVVETVVPAGEKEGMVFSGTAVQGESDLGRENRVLAAKDGEEFAPQRIANPAVPETAETAYLFRHALMQKAAYHLQLPSVRAYLHQLAAGTIEDMFVRASEPSGPSGETRRDASPDRGREFYRDLAEHYGKAGIVEKEIDYLEKAAAYAAGNYKNQEAVELYSRLIERLERSKLQTPDSKVRTARAMYRQAKVYDLIGMWKEAIERHQQGLALAQACLECGGHATVLEGENAAVTLQNAELVVDAQVALAAMYRQRGRMKEAMEMSDSAMAFAEHTGHASAKATAICNLGLAYKAHGDYARAAECHQRHLQLAEELGDKAGRARAVGNLGNILSYQDDFVRAMECYEEQLRLAEELGDKTGKAAVICNMGIVFRQQGDYARAMECYQKHLQLAEEIGDKAGKATVFGNMGIVCRLQNDYPRAMEYYRRHLQLAEELGDKAGKARTTGNMGNVYYDQGDFTRAMECYQKHLQLAEELSSKEYTAFALAGIGKVSVKIGQYEDACARLETALMIWEELKSRQVTTGPLIALAEAYAERARKAEAGTRNVEPADRKGHQGIRPLGDQDIRGSEDQVIGASGDQEEGALARADSGEEIDWREKAREVLNKARALATEFKQTHWLGEIEKLEKTALGT